MHLDEKFRILISIVNSTCNFTSLDLLISMLKIEKFKQEIPN